MSLITLTLMAMNTVMVATNYDYDELGRVIAETSSAGLNVRYSYDAEGRVTQITDSQNRVTKMSYDPLGRMIQSVDAANGVTHLSYDVADRLTRVSDPRGLTTTYEYDGFGQLWKQNSPDTGVTDHQYDASGLRIATVRNDGSVVGYGYDGLGRATSITAEGQQQTFSYDSCVGGKGRLCGSGAPGASNSFAYSTEGQIISRKDRSTLDGVSTEQTTSYAFDALGRLSTLTYPDGATARYAYTSLGQAKSLQLTIGATTHAVIADTTYTAIGTRKRLAYGNGLARTYALDSSGRLEAMAVRRPDTSLVSRTNYSYSADNEIARIGDDVDANRTQVFGYDSLSRLTQLQRAGASHTLGYDAGGNYDRYETGSQLTTYNIDPQSNRIQGYVAPGVSRSYQYDGLGNRISETAGSGTSTWTYGPFNRMEQSNVGGLSTQYLLNAFGQRVGKRNSQSASLYFYQGQNQLLAEQTDAAWTNYLWFDGELVGIGRNGQVSHVHTDHLGRPEHVTNSSQQMVWRAYNYAYGRSVLQDDIGGLNLGFPGQYYDAESGLWYNGFRDYDATIGRYVQSDPIGLAGGLSAYAYAENDPVRRVDPYGLESSGSFNNGGHRQKWESGVAVRPVDYIKVQVSLYVFSASRTFSRSGSMFRAGGIARQYPRFSGKMQASVSIGWLNQCDVPSKRQVDGHIGGYGMSGAAGYRGVGGGLNYSPGGGTSTEIGIGIGGGASPGEVSEKDGNWGGGW